MNSLRLTIDFYDQTAYTIIIFPEGALLIRAGNLNTDQEIVFMSIKMSNKGQGLVEYAMIIMLVAIIVIVVVALLGPAVGNMYSTIVPRI